MSKTHLLFPTILLALTIAFCQTCPIGPVLAVQENEALSDAEAIHLLNRATFGPRPGDLSRLKKWGARDFIEEQLHPEQIQESKNVIALLSESEIRRESNEDLLRLFQSFQAERARLNERRQSQASGKITAGAPPEEMTAGGDRSGAKAATTGGAERGSIPEVVTTGGAGDQGKPPSQAPPATGASSTPVSDLFRNTQRRFILSKLMRDVDSPRQLEAVMTEFWFNHFNVWIGKEYDGILVGPYVEEAIRPHVL